MQAGLFTRLLDRAHHVPRHAFLDEFRRQLEVEHHDGIVPGQGLARDALSGLEGQGILAGLKQGARDLDAPVVQGVPFAFFRGDQDGLDLAADSGPQHLGVDFEPEGRVGADVITELDAFDVDLVGDEVQVGLNFSVVAAGHHQLGQGLAHPGVFGGAQGQGGGADLAHAIHLGNEFRVCSVFELIGPVAEVNALLTRESAVDLLAHEREQGADHPAEHNQSGIEGVVRVLLVGIALGLPEARPAAPDIPVVERVDVGNDSPAGRGQVVAIEIGLKPTDQFLGFGQEIPIQQMAGVGPEPGLDAIGIGVEAKKIPCVPDRVDDQTNRILNRLAIAIDFQVAASHHRRGDKEPAQSIGADAGEDFLGVGIVAQTLAEFLAVFGEHDAMAEAVLERRPIEEGRGHHHHEVEPAPGLGLVLGDEIRGKMFFEPFLVLEGVVDLGEGHGARFEPAVENLGNPAHGRLAGRVVGVGADQGVDERAMQVIGPNAKITLEFVQAAVDVDSRVVGVVALPDGDRRSPEAVARNRPIPGAFEPAAKKAIPYVLGNPVDVLVEFHHAVADGHDVDVPGIQGLVDQRGVGAPAVGVVVEVALLLDHGPRRA